MRVSTTRSRSAFRLAACCVALLSACSDTPDVVEPTLTTIPDATNSDEGASDSTGSDSTGSEQSLTDDSGTETTTADADVVEQETAARQLSGELTATVIATHPHDATAFTQGLEFFNGRFVEGTGLYGESGRRIVNIDTGEPVQVVPIDADLFGEGVTVVGDELLQLTWKAGVLIRSDVETLTEISRDTYTGEGWGLCFDGEIVAMSNGSSTLTFRDPESFDAIRTVDVTLDGTSIENLNELECVNGQIIANIWLRDLIVVIDPTTGEVVATLDGSPLRPDTLAAEDSSFALNGIAHDPDTGRFYITGKLWPVVYEVELS